MPYARAAGDLSGILSSIGGGIRSLASSGALGLARAIPRGSIAGVLGTLPNTSFATPMSRMSPMAGGGAPRMIGGGGGGSRGRMNYGNAHALRRAIRRLEGAEKQYAKLLKITHPHKSCSHTVAAPKFGRRKKS